MLNGYDWMRRVATATLGSTALVGLAFTLPANAQEVAPPPVEAKPDAARLAPERAKAFDAALEAERERQGLIGLAVAVIEDGEVVHVGTYGFADKDRDRKVSADTLFRWASVAKPLTAVVAMQLVQKERLALDDTTKKHLRATKKNAVGDVTVEQLLCHRSGVGHYRQMGDWQRRLNALYGDRAKVEWSAKKTVDIIRTQPLAHPPGERYHYTTFGYNLLGAIVEAAGKEPFAEQVDTRIAKPLGMTTLEPDYEFVKRPHRTMGYAKVGKLIVPSAPGDVSWKLPGGGFHSTVGDMARFGIGLMDGKLLSEETQAEMWRPRADEGKTSGYALGFGVKLRDRKVTQVSHSGAQSRTRTLLVLEPRKRRGIAIMTNSEWGKTGAVRKAAATILGW